VPSQPYSSLATSYTSARVVGSSKSASHNEPSLATRNSIA